MCYITQELRTELVLGQHSKNSALLMVLLALLLTSNGDDNSNPMCYKRGKSGSLGDTTKREYQSDLGWG